MDFTNNNSGFISVLLFILGLIIAWISGLFKLLRNNPEFRIELLEQCSFCCIIDLNKTYNNLPVTKTAFVIYVNISNIGKASSSIGKIRLGYRKSDFKHRLFSKRIWITETIATGDFTYNLNYNSVKVFPFLKQRNQIFENNTQCFLQVGQYVNGIVYFEQKEAYGSYMPRANKDLKHTNVKLEILDVFDNKHSKTFDLKLVDSTEALQYNESFGQTFVNDVEL